MKPSLVEWKQRSKEEKKRRALTLKPSLVEWKPRVPRRDTALLPALKPSLVEWKLGPLRSAGPCFWILETFLSGMETCRHSGVAWLWGGP